MLSKLLVCSLALVLTQDWERAETVERGTNCTKDGCKPYIDLKYTKVNEDDPDLIHVVVKNVAISKGRCVETDGVCLVESDDCFIMSRMAFGRTWRAQSRLPGAVLVGMSAEEQEEIRGGTTYVTMAAVCDDKDDWRWADMIYHRRSIQRLNVRAVCSPCTGMDCIEEDGRQSDQHPESDGN